MDESFHPPTLFGRHPVDAQPLQLCNELMARDTSSVPSGRQSARRGWGTLPPVPVSAPGRHVRAPSRGWPGTGGPGCRPRMPRSAPRRCPARRRADTLARRYVGGLSRSAVTPIDRRRSATTGAARRAAAASAGPIPPVVTMVGAFGGGPASPGGYLVPSCGRLPSQGRNRSTICFVRPRIGTGSTEDVLCGIRRRRTRNPLGHKSVDSGGSSDHFTAQCRFRPVDRAGPG